MLKYDRDGVGFVRVGLSSSLARQPGFKELAAAIASVESSVIMLTFLRTVGSF
jgi:hypothetical protein